MPHDAESALRALFIAARRSRAPAPHSWRAPFQLRSDDILTEPTAEWWVRAEEGDSHMTDLSFTPAVELIRLYRGGKTSPLEVLQAILDGQPVGKAMQRSYLTYAFSVLGLPAISIPCGFDRRGGHVAGPGR